MTAATVTPFQRALLAQEPPIRSHAELARRAGVDKSAITRLLDGRAGELVRMKVAAALDVTVDQLDGLVNP